MSKKIVPMHISVSGFIIARNKESKMPKVQFQMLAQTMGQSYCIQTVPFEPWLETSWKQLASQSWKTELLTLMAYPAGLLIGSKV